MRKRWRIPADLLAQLASHGYRPTDFVIYVTSTCNLRCKHCYVGDSLLDEANQYALDDLTRFVDSMAVCERVTLLGGEPLLYPGIGQLLRSFSRFSDAERRITTNLTYVKGNLLNILVDSGFKICVSLDGSEPRTHDEVRGSGTYNKSIFHLKKLAIAGADIEVTYTVNQVNFPSFWKLVQLCKEFGITQLNVHRWTNRGNALANLQLAIGASRWRELVGELREADRPQGSLLIRYELGYVTVDEYDSLVLEGYQPLSKGSYYSKTGGHRLVLYPDGRLHISSEGFGEGSHIADVRNGFLSWNQSEANELSVMEGSGGNPSLLNRNIRGDERFPVPLSVSWREVVRV